LHKTELVSGWFQSLSGARGPMQGLNVILFTMKKEPKTWTGDKFWAL